MIMPRIAAAMQEVAKPYERKLGLAATKMPEAALSINQIDTMLCQAKEVLGYSPRSKTPLNLKTAARAALAKTLRELDISILDPRSVTRYKRAALAAVRKLKRRPGWYRWQWESQPLQTYQRLIPDEAIVVALRIKERLPEATFKIEALRRYRVQADPFLLVSLKGASYYLMCWDEPGFEG
jgi:hypothetical protein